MPKIYIVKNSGKTVEAYPLFRAICPACSRMARVVTEGKNVIHICECGHAQKLDMRSPYYEPNYADTAFNIGILGA